MGPRANRDPRANRVRRVPSVILAVRANWASRVRRVRLG